MFKLLLSLATVATIANAGWVTSAQSFFDKSIDTEKRQLATYEVIQ